MSHGVDTLFLDHSARAALKEVAWLAEQGTGPAAGY
jgi:4-hydroxy-2-oxoheptanedioate aldolase